MRPLLVAAFFLTLTLAGCSGGGGGRDDDDDDGNGAGEALLDAPADPPVGTTWDFQFSGASSGTSRATLEAHEARGGHEAARVKTTTASSGASINITAWNRRSDGAQIEAQSSTTAPIIGTITSTTTWDPPCQMVRYPMVQGDEYTVSCTSSTTSGAGGQPTASTTTANVEILGTQTVTVPAGTFEAVHVRATLQDGSVQDSHYLPDGCGIAKSVTTKDGASSTTELKSTTC